jgi:serine/threonine protein kinase
MLVGQQLGPFIIDKELGSGAMGTVYRARYTKTGQVVAIKIVTPGLGTTNASAMGRFEREAEILKQLNHPNIVRLFGVGKNQGQRYFAMEFIEGESLDRVMARRDRMSWEEVVALGMQLCSALQHAHEKGIVHRDLKPSNLMVLRDGTVKLTDFGIAKDLDETQLTSTNCTVGTAAYMSPEQCRGERNLSHKSDLYSLGVVLYELITGRKPFQAESAMDMFLLHTGGSFERPSRLVLTMPVWLDTLICQLLEKKAEHRPLDAAMVASVLGSIQEKVEAQQSAGVDVARARLGDLPREKRKLAEEDKEAARTLLGRPKRPKKPKKRPGPPVWLQAAGLVVALIGVGLAIWLLTRPASADSLHREAKKLWDSGKPGSRDSARVGPIKKYLALYGSVPGEKTDDIRKWADEYDAARVEAVFQKHINKERKGQGYKVGANNDAEVAALEAALAEYDGEAAKARQSWQEALKKWPEARGEDEPLRIDLVAEWHLRYLDAVPGIEKRLLDATRPLPPPWMPLAQGTEGEALSAFRAEKFGDILLAREKYDNLREQLVKELAPVQRSWYVFAAVKARQMKNKLGGMTEEQKDRKKLVEQAVVDITEGKKRGERLVDLRARCLDIVDLYGLDPDLKGEVQKASIELDAINKAFR